MAITRKQVKDLNSPSMTDAQLDRCLDYVAGEMGITKATPEDLIQYMCTDLIDKMLAKEWSIAQDAITKPQF